MDIKELSVRFKADINEFREKMDQVKKLTKQVGADTTESNGKMTASMQKVADRIKDTADKVQLLKKQFQDKRQEIDALTKKLSELREKYKEVTKVTSEFGSVDGIRKQREDLIKSIHDMESEIPKLKKQLEIAPDGFASTEQLKSQLTDYKMRLNNAREEVEKLDNAIEKLGQSSPDKLKAEIEKVSSKLLNAVHAEDNLKAKLDSANRSMSTQSAQLQEMGNKAQSSTTKSNRLKSGIDKLKNTKSATDSAKRNISSIGGSADAVTKKLSKTVSSIRRLSIVSLGMRVIKSVFGELRSVMTSYISQNEVLNARVEALKNAFGQALAPIINLVVGLFEKLMPVILKVSECISNLIASLGISKKLNATAGALNGIASSTKKVADEQNKLYGFDQITKVGEESDDKKEDTAGGFTYDSSKIDSFFNEFKAAFEKGGWSEIGKTLGNKVNGLFDSVDFATLGTKVGKGVQSVFELLYNFLDTIDFQKIGSSVADFLNNAFENIDFGLVGKTFAKKWTVLVDTLYGFATKFDWSQLGVKISDFVNGWFEEIDWAKTGQTISALVRGLLETLKKFIANTDWAQIGRDIYTLLASIDWTGILSDLAYLIGQAIGALAQLLWGFIEVEWNKLVGWWKKTAFEDGKFTIGGLLEGIGEACKNIGVWLYDTLIAPLVNGFKDMLGIHSPSTVFAEFGTFLVEGLKNGIVDTFHRVITAVSDKITTLKGNVVKGFDDMKKSVSTVFDNVKTKISEVWDKVLTTTKTFINKFLGFIENMLNKPVNVINGFIETVNKLGSIKALGFEIGINLPKLSSVNIPRLAEGTIVDRPTIAMIGEAGSEAVIPLKKQASWIAELAKTIAGTLGGGGQTPTSLTIPVYIGGNKLTTIVLDDVQKNAGRLTNIPVTA